MNPMHEQLRELAQKTEEEVLQNIYEWLKKRWHNFDSKAEFILFAKQRITSKSIMNGGLNSRIFMLDWKEFFEFKTTIKSNWSTQRVEFEFIHFKK
jgi:hypothetical protein